MIHRLPFLSNCVICLIITSLFHHYPLLSAGCRIGNLLVPNDNYCKFEDWLIPILDQMLLEQNTEVGTIDLEFFVLCCHRHPV